MEKPEIERFLTALASSGVLRHRRRTRHWRPFSFCTKRFWHVIRVARRRGAREAAAALPVVLTRPEVEALLTALDAVSWIMAMLLYGSGLRLMKTTMIYTHVLNRGGRGIQSPAGRLLAGAAGMLARSGEPRSTPGREKPS
jgi:site-specific recombinase XerD